eukprot:gene4380-4286_t
MVAVLAINFSLIHAAPGDPASVIAGEMGGGDQAVIDSIKKAYGLDKPLHEQFITYLGKSVRGDLGMSYTYNKPVSSLIAERIGPTILLVLTALLVAIAVGTLLGVFASLKPKSFSSAVVTVFSLAGLAMPVFWTGILLVILFGKVWPVMPISGMYDVRNYAQALKAAPVLSPWREAWRVFRGNKAAMLGLVSLILIMLIMLVGPAWYAVDPFGIVAPPFHEPFVDSRYWLGSDYLGRDIVAGMLIGGRATLLVGVSSAAITVVIGISVGALAGYFGGWIDAMLSRLTELFQVLPALLFAMVLVTLFQPSLGVVICAIGMVSWTGTARLTRAEFIRLRGFEYVNAARTMGAGHWRLIWREILPNAMAPLIVSATLVVGVAILFEAGLSFLGLSDPNVMSWGMMIGSNRRHILECWWAVTLPGAAIFLTVLSVSLVGDGLNDALNPKMHLR